MSSVLVLYSLDSADGLYVDRQNAFEAPILRGDREVYLGDLLAHLTAVKSPLAYNHAFSAEFQGRFVLLPSPLCVLPIRDDDTLVMRIRRLAHPLVLCHPSQTSLFAAQSRSQFAGNLPVSSSSSSSSSYSSRVSTLPPSTSMKIDAQRNQEREMLRRDISSSSRNYSSNSDNNNNNNNSSSAYNHSTDSRNDANYTSRNNTDSESSGLHAIVGDDAAIAINNATEVCLSVSLSLSLSLSICLSLCLSLSLSVCLSLSLSLSLSLTLLIMTCLLV
jgi:hypothetical protein